MAQDTISKYYSQLGRKEKAAFLMEACKECELSFQQFNRRRINNSWSKLERAAIEKLIPHYHGTN